AAAHPSSEQYLYFVSQMDGSGKSAFSHTLDEHNAAVRRYILKQK
ncbi:TPA: endolytic transglycosylase MltG, partial [Neisseria bacilliformis]